jgi:hypothetical protein
VIGPDTELVIDGYQRSANTFAVYAFQSAQQQRVRLAHHLHAPAQLIEAARRQIPALVLIRDPEETILSHVMYEPNASFGSALVSYERFYSRLLPYREAFVVGDFHDITTDLGSVIRRVNERFGTSFQEFDTTDENVRRCFELIEERPTTDPQWRRLILGFESGTVGLEELLTAWPKESSTRPLAAAEQIPNADRDLMKEALRERWKSPELERLRDQATAIYWAFL